MKKLLVVVDMQEDFVNGSLGTSEARAIIPAVRELLAIYRRDQADIVFTKDCHEANYLETQEGKSLPVPHCIRGAKGSEIISDLSTEGATVLEKPTFGSVALGEFAKKGEYDEITLCGVCTDICVVSNALLLKAFLPEASIRVIFNACAGTTTQKHLEAISLMRTCQVKIVNVP